MQENYGAGRRAEYRTVFVGADHAGHNAAEGLIKQLRSAGMTVVDCTANIADGDDYPDRAMELYRAMRAEGLLGEGVLVCASGEGMCMAAGKLPGIRAAEAGSVEEAKLAREHNGASVLCLGAKEHSQEELQAIAEAFLEAPFSEETRHVRRREKLSRLDMAGAMFALKDRGGARHPRVIPAILEEDLDRAEAKLTALLGLVSWVQVDVLDNTFARGKTIVPSDIDAKAWPFLFEAHLMTANPAKYVDMCARAGFARVVFHHEVAEDSGKVIHAIHEEGMEAGIALSPKTPLTAIDPYLHLADVVFLLGVEPGKSGQEMLAETPERVRVMRGKLPRTTPIFVDGGVNAQNLSDLVEAGADGVCAASAIFSGSEGDAEGAAQRIAAMENSFVG